MNPWIDELLLQNNRSVQAFSGYGVEGFSATKRIESSTLLNFSPGMSLCISFYMHDFTAGVSLDEIIGCHTPGGITKGWILVQQFNGMYFETGPGNNVNVVSNPGLTPTGLHRLAMVWRASDNHILVSHNGGPLTDKGALAVGTVPDGTCITDIGGKYSGTAPNGYLTDGSLCVAAMLSDEMTSGEAIAFSTIPLTTSRFQATAALEADSALTFYLNFAKHWNGIASTIVSAGSSPITFNVVGSPTLINYGETRYFTNTPMYSDSRNGAPFSGYTLRTAYARLRLSGVNGRCVGYETYSNFNQAASLSGFGLFSNNAYQSVQQELNLNSAQIYDAIPPIGSNKSVDLWEGNQVITGFFGGTITGNFITAIRVPVGANLVPEAPPQKRLVIYGDSIFSGFYPTTQFTGCLTARLRADFPTSGTGGVTCYAYGTRTLFNEGATSGARAILAAAIAAELNATGSNYLWIQIGTNDYGGSAWTAVNFGIAYADLLDKIHVLVPGVIIYCQTPFQRISPGSETANSQGDALSAYRTQITNVATARPSFCTAINGTTIYSNPTIYNSSTNPTGCIYTDGIHNVDNGIIDIKNFIKTTIGY